MREMKRDAQKKRVSDKKGGWLVFVVLLFCVFNVGLGQLSPPLAKFLFFQPNHDITHSLLCTLLSAHCACFHPLHQILILSFFLIILLIKDLINTFIKIYY